MPIIQSLITKAVGPLITEAFAKWIILWVAEIVAKSTKNPYDDQLVAKIKELLNG